VKDLNQVLLNPIRSRIIQYLAGHQTATAGEIALLMTDVPRTTLYRHLNVLTKNNIITVVAENRVRGSVERTYALNLNTVAEQNTKENATHNAFGFLMKIYGDFERYFNDENANPGTDKVFLSNVTLLLSDEEFDEFLAQTNAFFLKHLNNTPNESRKTRSLSLISAAGNDERRSDNETNGNN